MRTVALAALALAFAPMLNQPAAAHIPRHHRASSVKATLALQERSYAHARGAVRWYDQNRDRIEAGCGQQIVEAAPMWWHGAAPTATGEAQMPHQHPSDLVSSALSPSMANRARTAASQPSTGTTWIGTLITTIARTLPSSATHATSNDTGARTGHTILSTELASPKPTGGASHLNDRASSAPTSTSRSARDAARRVTSTYGSVVSSDPSTCSRLRASYRFHKRAVQWLGRELRETRARLVPVTPAAAICSVFGGYCSQAISVARCESGLSVYASNGQYLGLFQMGTYARSRYGHSYTAYGQARAAYGYFRDSGYSWAPWSCKP